MYAAVCQPDADMVVLDIVDAFCAVVRFEISRIGNIAMHFDRAHTVGVVVVPTHEMIAWIAGGTKTEDQIKKQREKVEKEQKKLQEF